MSRISLTNRVYLSDNINDDVTLLVQIECAIIRDENWRLTIFQEFYSCFSAPLPLNDTLFAFNALNNNCDTMCSLSNSSVACTRILKSCLNVNEV